MFTEITPNIKEFTNDFPLPFILDSVGMSEEQEDILRPSGYYCYHVLCVTKGECVFQVNGQKMILPAGRGVFLRPNIPHSYYKSGEILTTSWFTFCGADALLDYYGMEEFFAFDVPSFMHSSMKELESACNWESNVITRSALGYSFLVKFLQACFAPFMPLGVLIDEFLEINYERNLSLDDVAEKMKMNKFTLSRYYMKETGTTIMERLKQIRIAKAKKFLVNTNRPVREIGILCGFDSASYFGKIFKEATGMTPKAYRDGKK